jgi:UDP-glucuronate 4-epimerase
MRRLQFTTSQSIIDCGAADLFTTSIDSMTVLVTGGAGFIGSHLVEQLLAATTENVVVLDNFNDYYDPRLKRANAAALAADPRATVVEGDFCDQALVTQVLQNSRVRAICHLGGSPGVPFSLKHPQEVVRNNVEGTLSVLEAARTCPVEQFLFSSSSTVYGRGAAAPFVEDAPLGIPSSPYGASKRAAELLGLTYHQLYGVPFVALRLFNVYGPRLRPELALAAFTRAILADEPLPLFGDGTIRRDFTHVSDVCRGFLAALGKPDLAGQCVNLGNDQPIEMRRLIGLLEDSAGRQARIERKPARAEDMPLTHADLSKARRLLGYQPRVAIDEGVREYVAWVRQRWEG